MREIFCFPLAVRRRCFGSLFRKRCIDPLKRWSSSFCAAAYCASIFLVLLGAQASAQKDPAFVLPPIRHVFLIVLENKNYTDTFGPQSVAPYLAKTLRAKGVLLPQYYGTGHSSLDNYIAIMGGQGMTPQTSGDCGTFEDFHQTGTAPYGQVVGQGCVYPASVKTLANQLMTAGFTWKGYMEDMGNDPSRESATCG